MLYFIGTKDKIKIGISANPKGRLSAIQTGNPDQCRLLLQIDVLNDREIERLLHERLSFCRRSGEWFHLSFAAAFDHLIAIRSALAIPGSQELCLSSPRKPYLSDCREEFEEWIRATYYSDREWDQHRYPLSYCWEQLRDEFLRERGQQKCQT